MSILRGWFRTGGNYRTSNDREDSLRKQPKRAASTIYVTDDIILPVDLSIGSYQCLGASPAG